MTSTTTYRRVALLSGMLLCSACADTPLPVAPRAKPSPAPAMPSTEMSSTEVIVLFAPPPAGQGAGSPSLGMAARTSLLAPMVSEPDSIQLLPEIDGAVLHDVSDEEMAKLARDPRVSVVERVQPVFPLGTPTESWGLDRLDQPELPLSSTYKNPYGTGAGVRIYIIDSGIRPDHIEFTGRIQPGPDFVTGGGTLVTSDCLGHGTGVASLAAGYSLGAAPGATIVPVRIFGCANGSSHPAATSSVVVAAVDYVMRQKRANRAVPMVLNASLGTSSSSNAIDESFRRAVAEGVVAVVAAGNDDRDACGISPAREPLAITVGATTKTDARVPFSNIGRCVDLYAPGHEVLVARSTSSTDRGLGEGTSLASPYVAGLVAAWLGQHPGATAAQASHALLSGAAWGRVTNVASPVLLAQADFTPKPPPLAPVARFTVACEGVRCVFDASTTPALSYTWEYGGAIQAIAIPRTAPPSRRTVTYTSSGIYRARLTIVGPDGRSATTVQEVRAIATPPVAVIAPPNCSGQTCFFQGGGSTGTEGIRAYAWDFGDGGRATTATPRRTYAAFGTYTVRLTVTDGQGQTASATREVTIHPPPTALLSASCVLARCTLTASGSAAAAGIESYTFTPGDGSPSVTQSSPVLSYIPRSAGTYTATVHVRDRASNTSTATAQMTVRPR